MRRYPLILKTRPKIERKVVRREKGIEYFFHTNEKGQHNKKHIHARYQDTETSIGLDKVETLVSTELRPRKKHKEALDYVKKHKIELLCMWDKLVATDIKSIRSRQLRYKLLIKRSANIHLNKQKAKCRIIKVYIKDGEN